MTQLPSVSEIMLKNPNYLEKPDVSKGQPLEGHPTANVEQMSSQVPSKNILLPPLGRRKDSSDNYSIDKRVSVSSSINAISRHPSTSNPSINEDDRKHLIFPLNSNTNSPQSKLNADSPLTLEDNRLPPIKSVSNPMVPTIRSIYETKTPPVSAQSLQVSPVNVSHYSNGPSPNDAVVLQEPTPKRKDNPKADYFQYHPYQYYYLEQQKFQSSPTSIPLGPNEFQMNEYHINSHPRYSNQNMTPVITPNMPNSMPPVALSPHSIPPGMPVHHQFQGHIPPPPPGSIPIGMNQVQNPQGNMAGGHLAPGQPMSPHGLPANYPGLAPGLTPQAPYAMHPYGYPMNLALWYEENQALLNKRRIIKRRTRTGCLTCRKRRIKCDERKPYCFNCERSRKVCLGYNSTKKSKDDRSDKSDNDNHDEDDHDSDDQHNRSPELDHDIKKE